MIEPELVFIARHVPAGVRLLDVGSSTAEFRRRPALAYDLARLTGCEVVSFDAKAGEGVDVVGDAERLASCFEPMAFDAVVCTNLLEHVRRPWAVVLQCATVLKVGGVAVFTAPWSYREHADPIDCWRVGVEGMRGLVDGLFREMACEQARDAGKGIVVTMFAGVRV